MVAILDSMIRHVNCRSESELALVGLTKNSDGVVVGRGEKNSGDPWL